MHLQFIVFGGIVLLIICIAVFIMLLKNKNIALKEINRILIREVTGRKLAEDKLLFEMQFTDTVLNCIPGIFYMYDDEEKIVRWNAKYQNIIDCTAEEMSLTHKMNSIAEESRNKAREIIDGVFVNKNSDEAELLLLNREGKKIPFNCTVAPFK